MSWDTTLVSIVRSLINDMGATPVYDDSRIEQAILVGGLLASQDFPFSTTYIFDFSTPALTPDPTLPETLDTVAMALFGLKAACTLNLNSYQNSISTGIRVKSGDESVDTTSGFGGFDSILKNGPCAQYKALVADLYKKNAIALSSLATRAVTTPQGGFFNGGVWDTRNLYNSFMGW